MPQNDSDETTTGTGTILLVDDDATVLETMLEIFNLAGYNVLTASSGAAAIQLFEQRHKVVSAVITDLTMPGMTGVELVRQLRSIEPEVPCVLISGYSGGGENDLPTNAIGFVSKPFRASQLINKVQELIN